MPQRPDLTRLLSDWRKGDKALIDQITPVLYAELHKLAERNFRLERANHTLQPTALVHEAYIRLIDQTQIEWNSRAHFFGIAANIMRHILVDHARKHSAEKRGGDVTRLSLAEAAELTYDAPEELLALHAALDEFAALDERKARIIELRYFGNLSIEEIAEVMEISVATVGRELRVGQAWLQSRMRGGAASGA